MVGFSGIVHVFCWSLPWCCIALYRCVSRCCSVLQVHALFVCFVCPGALFASSLVSRQNHMDKHGAPLLPQHMALGGVRWESGACSPTFRVWICTFWEGRPFQWSTLKPVQPCSMPGVATATQERVACPEICQTSSDFWPTYRSEELQGARCRHFVSKSKRAMAQHGTKRKLETGEPMSVCVPDTMKLASASPRRRIGVLKWG